MAPRLADLYWLAGLLEGEGTFMPGPPSAPRVPLLRVEMTDADVVAHAAGLLGRTFQPQSRRSISHETLRRADLQGTTSIRKRSFSTTIKGAHAVALMRAIHPMMGERRRRQIQSVLDRPHNAEPRWLRSSDACSAISCSAPARKRSLCKTHYDSWWKGQRVRRPVRWRPRGPALWSTPLESQPVGDHATAWLAGLLEGEGTFRSNDGYPVVSVHMCDRDVVVRAAEVLGGTNVWDMTTEKDLADGWSPSWKTAVSGARGAEVMRSLRPLMGCRRTAEIDLALHRYSPVRLTKAPALCTVNGCTGAHRSRGLCHKHYMSWSRDLTKGRPARIRPLR